MAKKITCTTYVRQAPKCPFYQNDDGRSKLTCEGVTPHCTMTWNFNNHGDLVQQMEVFCCEYYRNCEVYRMLMEAKY